MHSSYFEYYLSRPYPFRWFTPVVTVGGLIALVLLSLLNFVSSGYTLAVQYSQDPNATVQDTRLSSWPSFLTTKLQPSCQSTNIPVNGKLLTTNSALTYTLSSVLQNANEVNQTLSSSLIYHNNPLPNCTIDYVSIRIDYAGRTAAQIALVSQGVVAQAHVICVLDTIDQGVTVFNLTAEYDYMPATVSIYSGFYVFVGRDALARASLYWGESLLSMYWLKTARDFDDAKPAFDDQHPFTASMDFTPSGNTTDLTNVTFFRQESRAIVLGADGDHIVYVTEGWPSDSVFQIWSSSDILAKSLYSTVLTDLGQNSTTVPNILTDAKLLEYFTTNFSQLNEVDDRAQPAHEAFSDTNTTTGPLGIHPSVLAATYLCQVPQRRPLGSVILTILIADLVFLQALWTIFKLIVDTRMKRQDKQATFCEGCRSRELGEGGGGSTPLLVRGDDRRTVASPRSPRFSRSHSDYEMMPPEQSRQTLLLK